MKRKLRMGMVGGGRGAFIGPVHRLAAALEGRIELVCGAFSSDPEKAKSSGADLMLPASRCYGTFSEMIQSEALLPADQRMEFVAIVTPNHEHFAPAKMALENGFHVLCDKPLAFDLKQAQLLQELVEKTGLLFCLTHNYTAYPMVKEARNLVQRGALGEIRKVMVEYLQGSLTKSSVLKAPWRLDPNRSGAGGCITDIGTHAENLMGYITGLSLRELAADLTTFVQGDALDDDASLLLRFENGAKGTLSTSKVAAGEENALSIKIYGEKGGLEWHQMEPNTLFVKWNDAPTQIYRTASNSLSEAAKAAGRLPVGHPEGYLEAFANVYHQFADHLFFVLEKQKGKAPCFDYPSIHDGVRGMAFIEAALTSSKNNAAWTQL